MTDSTTERDRTFFKIGTLLGIGAGVLLCLLGFGLWTAWEDHQKIKAHEATLSQVVNYLNMRMGAAAPPPQPGPTPTEAPRATPEKK